MVQGKLGGAHFSASQAYRDSFLLLSNITIEGLNFYFSELYLRATHASILVAFQIQK